jgi:transcriptional regulator GlxA family with amidase domain
MASGQRSSTPGVHREIWQTATHYIEQHVSGPLSIAEIARAALTSERQLQRVFAVVGATTVRGYVADTRMRRAHLLLTGSNDPLTVIAGDVGYGHVSAFVKAFRLYHGLTPAQLRRAPM